jgi:hypothetical protein
MNDFLASGSCLWISALVGITKKRVLFFSSQNDNLDNEEFLAKIPPRL